MEAAATDMVTLTIDGKEVSVPKGSNLIEAAKTIGVDIPHYCYHPHLSVPGNCRMCQVKVEGAPKLMIGCHSLAQDGMDVKTHETSKEVEDAQAATLEFILINHPLDCTVCDQAGHCKLQDYHFEYNARPSRFIENKVRKEKAKPLGPTVMLDAERCIMCTRCIRFCDEVTKTSELGMVNRGDRSEIEVNPDRLLENPLSGTVVDLCPVGALTHRNWRFNTRIWFTKQTDSICPGCSTGCNVKVAVRDHEVVNVKARENAAVNKEWLCDEGRYGFERFLPENRVKNFSIGGNEVSAEAAIDAAAKLKGKDTLVFLAADLLLEEYLLIKEFTEKVLGNAKVALGYRERSLSAVEQVLVSPDYAANFRGAELAGIVSGDLQKEYEAALKSLEAGEASNVLIIGDRGILEEDQNVGRLNALKNAECSVALICDAESPLGSACGVIMPARSVLEKSGMMINRTNRLQYSDRVIDFPLGTDPEWRTIAALSAKCGTSLTKAESDRERTLECLSADERFAGLTIASIKDGGVSVGSSTSQQAA